MGNLVSKIKKNFHKKDQYIELKPNQYIIYLHGPIYYSIITEAKIIIEPYEKKYELGGFHKTYICNNLYILYNTDFIQSFINDLNPPYSDMNFLKFIDLYFLNYKTQGLSLYKEHNIVSFFLNRLFNNMNKLDLNKELKKIYTSDKIINDSFFHYLQKFGIISQTFYTCIIDTRQYAQSFFWHSLDFYEYTFNFFSFIKDTTSKNLSKIFELVIKFIEYLKINYNYDIKIINLIKYCIVMNFYHVLESNQNTYIYNIVFKLNIQQVCMFLFLNNFFDIDLNLIKLTNFTKYDKKYPKNIFDIMKYHYYEYNKESCYLALELINYSKYSHIQHVWISAVIRYILFKHR